MHPSCCSQVRKLGACVALHEVIPKNRAQTTIPSIVSKIRSSGARVILVFAVEQDAAALFDEVLRQDLFIIFDTNSLSSFVFLQIQVY